jgi:hypothetical protein
LETQKVYVGEDNKAALLCPHCGSSKTVDAAKYQDRKDPLEVKCACDSTFQVVFEFRKAFRKTTNLVGHYCTLPRCKGWHEMIVENISPTGLGFKTLAAHGLKEGDQVRAKFRLDDGKRSLVDKDLIVREIRDQQVGCQFASSLQHGTSDKALGFYLMP